MTSCRTCLGPLDLPINLFDPNYTDLLDALQRLLAFQVYVEGGEFKVCWHCQGKLMWVSEFQDVCLKSVDPLRNIDVKLRDNVKKTDDEQLVQYNYDVDVKSEHSNAYDDDDDDDDPYDYNEVIEPLQPIEVRLARCPRIEELISSKHSSKKPIRVNENTFDRHEDDPFLQEVDQSMSSAHSYSSVSENELDDDFSAEYTNDIATIRDPIDSRGGEIKKWSDIVVDEEMNPFVQEWAGSDFSHSPANEINDSDSDYDPGECFSEKRNSKARSKLDKRVKLKQLHWSEMQQARKEMYNSKRVLRNMQCCFCDFLAKNSMGIKQHMSRSHKNVNNWCNHCNIIADDMEGHRNVSRCHLWRCTICEKYYKNLKNLKIHLIHHQNQNESPSAKLKAIKKSCIESISGISTAFVDQDKDITIETENADVSAAGEASKLWPSDDSVIYNEETENQFNTIGAFKINKCAVVSKGLQKNSDCNFKDTTTNSLEADRMSLNTEGGDSNLKPRQNTPSATKTIKQYPASEVFEAITKLKRFFNDSKYSQCIFCAYIGKHSEFLREHVLKTHRDKYLENWCEHCNVQTKDLQMHREYVRCYKFECKFCKIAINNAKDLIVHMYSHGSFKDVVKAEFVRSGKLYYRQYPENQVKQATAEYNDFITRKRLQCLHCKYIAFTYSHLTHHMRTIHNSKMANWCKNCNLQTYDLKHHLDTTLCVPRKCKFCVKVYRKDRLINHLRLHCRTSTLLGKR